MKLLKVWSNGSILKDTKAIDSSNFSLHYSFAAWEGLRAYKSKTGGLKIFKLEEHIQRLVDSCKVLGLNIPYSKDALMAACEAVVKQSGTEDIYIRPIVYFEGSCESVHFGNRKLSVDILTFPIKKLHNNPKPITMAISSRVRSYPNHQMEVKCSMNYMTGQLALDEIPNVDDIFLVDERGYILEASVANFFIVKGDVIMTPPDDGSILPGITRRTVVKDIFNNPDIMFKKYKKNPRVVERLITRTKLYSADEIFLVGTYAEVVPVGIVDGRKISETPGLYTNIAMVEYQNLVRN